MTYLLGLDLIFPELNYIGVVAFYQVNIKSFSAPKLEQVGQMAFMLATHEDGIDFSFPEVTTIIPNAFTDAKIKSFSAPKLQGVAAYAFQRVNKDSDIALDLNFPELTTVYAATFEAAKLKSLYAPKLTDIRGNFAFRNLTVVEYDIIPAASGLETNDNIHTVYYTDAIPLFLSIASRDQLKTEYQSRGSCA